MRPESFRECLLILALVWGGDGAALETEKRFEETKAIIALSTGCVLMVALIAHLYFRI